jgi:hypothetical protein
VLLRVRGTEKVEIQDRRRYERRKEINSREKEMLR